MASLLNEAQRQEALAGRQLLVFGQPCFQGHLVTGLDDPAITLDHLSSHPGPVQELRQEQAGLHATTDTREVHVEADGAGAGQNRVQGRGRPLWSTSNARRS